MTASSWQVRDDPHLRAEGRNCARSSSCSTCSGPGKGGSMITSHAEHVISGSASNTSPVIMQRTGECHSRSLHRAVLTPERAHLLLQAIAQAAALLAVDDEAPGLAAATRLAAAVGDHAV